MVYDWSRQALAASPWRASVVPHIPAILFERAKQGRTITYGQLAQELYERHGLPVQSRKTLYGGAVGAVGFALKDLSEQLGEKIPPINLIVVAAATGLPGDGADGVAKYYLGALRSRDLATRHAYVLKGQKAVFDYGRWDEVASAFGVKLRKVTDEQREVSPISLPTLPRAYGPESKEHRALKKWVRSNPKVLGGFGVFREGEAEALLSSGDRLDVYFANKQQRLAVEVKAGSARPAELMRGIYQCVKYREVMLAEELALGRSKRVEAILVSTKPLPEDCKRLARLLEVEFVQMPKEAEQ